MRLSRVGAAAVACAAVALATAPFAAAAPSDDFLDLIADDGISWAPEDTPAVIDTGHAVCTDWDNGASFSKEVADLQSVTDWTDGQIGTFIGAATGAFCPEYRYKLG